MARVRGSLLLKLILAFWLVSILGIVIVALLAGRISTLEFTRYVNEIRYQGLVDKLAEYYNAHGDFTGAGYLLLEERKRVGNQAREYLVVSEQGDILLALARHIPTGLPSPNLVRFGFPINSDGHVAAYLVPLRTPPTPEETAVTNLRRINLNLFIGVLVATLIALAAGWFVARNLIRPLRDLDSAARSIAQGDLEGQVNIKSRDEIGALAGSFNQMTASLRRSRDLRRQMTADIAHELRNPLSIILGNAEAMSDGVLPPTREALEIIYDEARHLSRLVDDLRTLSLSESGELQLQRGPVGPAGILSRCASVYALRAAEKGLTIRTETAPGLPDVDVDAERIQQVLANLVDNSLKHTPTGGTIVLSAELEPGGEGAPVNTGSRVRITVADNGAGIQPGDLPFVFDRFYRGKPNASRLQDGSGLGLAISRALVELHGGQIAAESRPGEGTRITISLPVVPDHPAG